MKYTVSVRPSGVKYTIDEDKIMLDAAIENSIYLDHSCKRGDCEKCKVELLSGVVIFDGKKVSSGQKILSCKTTVLSNVEIEANYYEELRGVPRKTIPAKVNSAEIVSGQVLVLKLRMPSGNKLNYLAGQSIELSYRGVTRPYSIANVKNSKNEIELHIREVENGKMSQLLFNGLSNDTLMRVTGPNGTFFVRDSQSPIILMATGTGFAPVKAIAESLIQSGTNREIHIYWGNRKHEDFYSRAPEGWTALHPNIMYTPVLSQEVKFCEGCEYGYVQDVVLRKHENLEDVSVFACGSPKMIKDAETKLAKSGLDGERFFSDAFTAASI